MTESKRSRADKVVQLRVPDALLELATRDAARAGMPLSTWLRYLLLQHYQAELDKLPPKPWPSFEGPQKSVE